MKQKFQELTMRPKRKKTLDIINGIIEEYQADGYTLTLRQLYYQLVSRDIIENDQKQYKNLGGILKDGRLAGVVDWDAIEDRLRQVKEPTTWSSPKDILEAAKKQFQLNRHEGQKNHVEVWVEKDALSQVVERAANPYQVPVLVNRGYGSVSSVYETYQRLKEKINHGKERAIILYLGDHDPSGLDMIRDIQDRVSSMLEYDSYQDLIEVKPIALTMEQIRQYTPPPNPTKINDTRANGYIEKYGHTSWEVDALPPDVLNRLITKEIESYINLDQYSHFVEQEKAHKAKIESFISNFN